MNIHKNARLTPTGRALLVGRVLDQGLSVTEAAALAGVSAPTGKKWVKRFLAEGLAGLQDRSSAPHRSPHRISEAERQLWVEQRLLRRPQWQIARTSGRGTATISRWMKAKGLSRLPPLQPPVPIVRYEKELPGQLIHIDIKKLVKIGVVGHRIHGNRRQGMRGIGWEAVHLAIDDRSRVAFGQVLPDETADSCISFLRAAVARYASLGVKVTGVMTDNGAGYKNRFREACTALGIKLVHTRPYTPRTNGKAERLVQTFLREWAYARPYATSADRAANLGPFLHYYNWHRSHSALGFLPPASRLPFPNNVLESDT